MKYCFRTFSKTGGSSGGNVNSSNHGGLGPEMTPRSLDINKHGGGVNGLINIIKLTT